MNDTQQHRYALICSAFVVDARKKFLWMSVKSQTYFQRRFCKKCHHFGGHRSRNLMQMGTILRGIRPIQQLSPELQVVFLITVCKDDIVRISTR